jgi:hypothetical protein
MSIPLHQLMFLLPRHITACVLGAETAFSRGPTWAADLTDVVLTDSGPLQHAARASQLMCLLLEILPKYR